jgi:putative endonuclease
VTTARTKLGTLGERHARHILEDRGMRFIDSNWRAASGEIDLVMLDGEFVVMVEVKVRRGERAGTAEEAISNAKARRLLATGEWYMAEHPELGDCPWRIDLVAITLAADGRVVRHRHIPDAVVTG